MQLAGLSHGAAEFTLAASSARSSLHSWRSFLASVAGFMGVCPAAALATGVFSSAAASTLCFAGADAGALSGLPLAFFTGSSLAGVL